MTFHVEVLAENYDDDSTEQVFEADFDARSLTQMEIVFLKLYNEKFQADHGYTPSIESIAELYIVKIEIS